MLAKFFGNFTKRFSNRIFQQFHTLTEWLIQGTMQCMLHNQTHSLCHSIWVSRISRTCQTYCHTFFYVIFILSSRHKAPTEMRDHIFSLCRLCRRKEESQYILQTKELTYNITIEYCVFTRFFGSDHLWSKDH